MQHEVDRGQRGRTEQADQRHALETPLGRFGVRSLDDQWKQRACVCAQLPHRGDEVDLLERRARRAAHLRSFAGVVADRFEPRARGIRIGSDVSERDRRVAAQLGVRVVEQRDQLGHRVAARVRELLERVGRRPAHLRVGIAQQQRDRARGACRRRPDVRECARGLAPHLRGLVVEDVDQRVDRGLGTRANAREALGGHCALVRVRGSKHDDQPRHRDVCAGSDPSHRLCGR